MAGSDGGGTVFQYNEEEFGDVEGVKIIVDDLCVWGGCDEDQHRCPESLFDRIGCSGVKLNRPKCRFGVDNVGYVGHVLSMNGLKPSPGRIVCGQYVICF